MTVPWAGVSGRVGWAWRLSAKRAAVRAYSVGTSWSRLDGRRIGRLTANDNVVILNLHAVQPQTGSRLAGMSPEALDRLIGWLRRHATIVTIGELETVQPTQRPLAVLSFDDGYRDFLEYAAPVLEKHGVRANQNVVPACAERGAPPWNVQLQDALATVSPQRLAGLRLPDVRVSRDLAFVAPQRFAELVMLQLKELDPSQRETSVTELADQLPELGQGPLRPMLTAAEIREISKVHEIGAHSFEHESMGLQTNAYFEADLKRCRDWFDRHGLPMRIYAFPNGSHRPEQVAIAKAHGLRALLVGERPAVRTAQALHRITMFGSSARELRARIARAAR